MGSPGDFTRVYARFFPPLVAKARRILGPGAAAEDVAQETFVRFWGSELRLCSEPRAVLAWLYRTSTRLAVDRVRADRAAKVAPGDVEHLPCAVDVAAAAEAKAVLSAIAGLAPRDELAIAILCRVDGLSQPEVAFVLGTTERTVRRKLRRFDARLAGLRSDAYP